MIIVDLLLGLGIFLFGMRQIESSLRHLGRNKLRRIFSRAGTGGWKSVTLGIVTTALLQSSSMVSLMVQALAAAGLVPLSNAIGVILGANLGTTLTGWLVALVGFKLSLDQLAVPLIGAACLGLVFYAGNYRRQMWLTLCLGLGLLLFGLLYMKAAVEQLPALLPMVQLQGMPALIYLIIGTLLTALIQSSSATMMIALASLHAGLLDLPAAAALIIGADLGTTSTTALASIKGSPIKKQLALAHFSFNVVVDIAAFLFLLPLLPSLLDAIGLRDPLFGLVAFHSIFNLVGLVCFLPFLPGFAAWIDGFFHGPRAVGYPRLSELPLHEPEAALAALEHTVILQMADVLSLNGSTLALENFEDDARNCSDEFEDQYESIKSIEGELLQYSRKLQQQSLQEDQAQRLDNLVRCSREAVFSAKSIKDIRNNLQRLQQGEFGHYEQVYLRGLQNLYHQFQRLLSGSHEVSYIEESLRQIQQDNSRMHESIHKEIVKQELGDNLSSTDLSTLLNINREVFQATDRMRTAMELMLLPVDNEFNPA